MDHDGGEPVARAMSYAPSHVAQSRLHQAATVLSVFGWITWVIPFVGVLVAILSLVCAVLARRRDARVGIASIVVSVIGLFVSVTATVIYMAAVIAKELFEAVPKC